jgi:CheY-like chemotaxis protein
MVVEDEPDLYDTLLALFEIWSIDGVAFTNGTDAIKWIEDVDQGNTDTNIPELALLDIRLPGVTGPEIGQRLRQSTVLNDIAIVLMTAYHLTPQEEETYTKQAKSNNLLYKPLPSPVEFRTILQQAIDSQNQSKLQKTTESPKPPKLEKTPDSSKPSVG